MTLNNDCLKVDIAPMESKTDELISFQINTNKPSHPIVIKATAKDDRQTTFTSKATYISDENGFIDLNQHSPVEGDYNGVDVCGLFWSMQSKKGRMFVKHRSEPLEVHIEVYDNGKLITSEKVTRTFYQNNVVKKVLNDDTLVGSLFFPENADSLPAVVIVGGSDAGVHESAAALLASEGYVVFALAYFGREGLSKGIVDIPLEYVDHAFQYLKGLSQVDQERCGIIGFSRGSELALLYAAHFPTINSVIAVAPSAVVFPGIVNMQPVDKPAWKYKGEPLPYFPAERTTRDTISFFKHWALGKPFSGLDAINRNLQNKQQLEDKAIPVEKIKAPMMFIAGEDDHVQPAIFFTKKMERRLQNHEYKSQNEFIYYKNAGHFAPFPGNLPNLPQITGNTQFGMRMIFGGIKKDNAKTANNSWEQTVQFLNSTLKKEI
ncbi:acyl-CoA thioesterase/bile acid-CoA:amino acid N-acyltransferase family protein [Amphibacillus jilinensis]|uniref:acyl-CoA thioesterase/bile acid-CoA:amino acid N-acyltransferase family protein n=1 Tax=Amphibacillus jilinensis TaxID=1216008 RepID=UPI0002E6A5DF|nr:acyl-CoA thioesterase/bile acid-CoA:amino acid N-acyltransferase family protein [Amphibacillus jilinensis]